MKDQFVIAYLADFSLADAVVSHARCLAAMLNKGLILLYVEDSRYGGLSAAEAEQKLLEIESACPEVHPAHVALKGKTIDVIEALPTMLNGVIAVAGVDARAGRRRPTSSREVLRVFSQCKIAYLTVQAPLRNAHPYEKVGLGVDFRKESKEKLLWASYFARFNKSEIQVIHFDYDDEGLRLKWRNNMRFLDKFFRGLGISYLAKVVSGRAFFPEVVVADYAAQHCDVFISVTTDVRDRDVLEWFAGVQEQRVIRNAAQQPVLYLNPRDDIYVLCD